MEAAEEVIRAGLLRLGGCMLEQFLSADRGHRGPRVPCGKGHEAGFVSYRDKFFDTVLGLVTVTRAWYHCAECGHGLAPRDAELGVAREGMSPGLAAMNESRGGRGPVHRGRRAAGGDGRGPADRKACRAGGRGQRRRRGRSRARACPAHRRQQTGADPALAAAGQAVRRHRWHRRPDDLQGDGRPGREGRRRPRPHPRGQARRLLHPGQAGHRRLPSPGPGLHQHHRHLRARRRLRRPGEGRRHPPRRGPRPPAHHHRRRRRLDLGHRYRQVPRSHPDRRPLPRPRAPARPHPEARVHAAGPTAAR